MNKITLETLFLWTLVGFLALGQLGRITLAPGIVLYPHDVLLVFWSVYLLFTHPKQCLTAIQSASTCLQRTTKYWLPFFGVATLSLLISELSAFQLTPFLYLARISMYGFFAFLLWSTSKLSAERILTAVLGLGIITLATGVMQYLFIPDTRFLYILGFDDHYYRMVGTQLDPAFMGALLLISLSVVEHLGFLQKNTKTKFSLYLAFLLGIALTFSRASFLGFGVLTAYSMLTKKKQVRQIATHTLAVVIAVYVVVVVAHNTTGEGTSLFRTASISARVESFKQVLPNSLPEALIGNGVFYSQNQKLTTDTGVLTVPNQARVSDSLIGLLLQGVGILGLTTFVYMIGVILLWLYRAKQHAVVQLVVVLLVITQFNNTLLQPFVLVTTLLVCSSYLREYR
jgi:hypothetical protein